MNVVGAVIVAIVSRLAMASTWNEPQVKSPSQNENLLSSDKQYFILAPKRVRPDMTYKVYVTVHGIAFSGLAIRAILTNKDEEYASGMVEFENTGSKTILIKIPEGIINGTHMLTIMILGGYRKSLPLFQEQRPLHFIAKYRSLFIQTDKPLYFPPQQINYRIVGVGPDMSLVSGAMTIYLKDGRGYVVWRKLMQQLVFGRYEDSFQLEYPVNVGTWHIVVEAFGHVYDQPIDVVWYWHRRFEVKITAPVSVRDSEAAYSAIIKGEHMSRKEAYGNATVRMRCIDTDGSFMPGNIVKNLGYIRGSRVVDIPMAYITDLCGDSYEGYTLLFEAWIYDWELVETQNSTARTTLHTSTVVVRRLGNEFISFQPTKPFTVYFSVGYRDGSPYKNSSFSIINIEVTREGLNTRTTRESVIIPDDSIVRYTVEPRIDDTKITIHASYPNMTSQSDRVTAHRYYSQNGYYISITSPTKHPRTNQYMVFTVKTNFFIRTIHYVVMSKSQMLEVNEINMFSQQHSFSLAVSRAMLPSATLLVFCFVKNNVLTDALHFQIEDSELTQSSLTLNLGRDLTHNTVELVGNSTVGSYMSLSGHHQVWSLHGASTFIDTKRVRRELETYAANETAPYHRIWYHNNMTWDSDVYFKSETPGLDTNTTLDAVGLHVFTNMILSFDMGEELKCNRSLGLGQCISGACFELELACDGFPDCPDGYDEAGCPELQPDEVRQPEARSVPPFYTYLYDASWTFKTSYVNPSLGGQIPVVLDVPKLMDAYVFGAYFLHPEHGLMIVDQQIEFNLTRRFFMRCEAPVQLKLGEQIGVRCALFNKWDQYIEVLMTLHGDDKYRFINVEEYGIVSSYSPRLTAGDIQIMVSLSEGEEKYIYWPIQPVVVRDQVTVTITAWSIVNSDTEEVTFEIMFDGCYDDELTSYIIDLHNNPSVYTPYLDTQIPANWFQPGDRDILYVPGSTAAIIQIWGGLGTAGFMMDDYFDEGDQCLEVYTFDFAYNFVNMDYLHTLNKLDRKSKDIVLERLQIILMRQYAYMDDNGGYKMFRRSKSQCLWCTAMVLNYLHDFFVTEWAEVVYIPIEVLMKMAAWLISHQAPDGSFPEISADVYARYFQPVTIDGNGTSHVWHIPTTAYTVISLAKAERLTSSKVLESAMKGAEYLSSKLQHITDPFQMALVAYALDRSGHFAKDVAYNLLKSMARRGRYVYWSPEEVPMLDIKVVDNKQYIPPHDDYITLGAAGIATSYALLLHLAHGEFEASRPIAHWLVEYPVNGYLDKMLEAEALNAFSKRETNHEFYNMKITLSAPAASGWQEIVYINSTNFPNYHEIELSDNWWGAVAAHSEGTGYAQIHVIGELSYPKPHQLPDHELATVDLEPVSVRYSGRNASIMEMSYCVRWKRPDWAESMGEAFATFDIPSGYVMDRDEIERLYGELESRPGPMRVIFQEDQTLNIFFESVPQEEYCFSMLFRRWYPVSNGTTSHLRTLTEFHENAVFNHSGYTSFTLFHLHACQVCASFQCPYCPWYNKSVHVVPSTFSVLVHLLVILLIVIRLFS